MKGETLKRTIEISEAERDLLLSALESYQGDLDINWENNVDSEADHERLTAEAEAIEQRLIPLRFYHFCISELCDQSVENEGDLCGDHIDYNKAIKLGERAFNVALESGESFERATEIRNKAERKAIERLTAERKAKGEA